MDECYNDYEPTKATRLITDFVTEHLSNWYVRLGRRRFWKGDYTSDKIAAYQTLYTCLDTIARLMAPVAPFYADRLFRDLNFTSGKDKNESVHLADFPVSNPAIINKELEAHATGAGYFIDCISIKKESQYQSASAITPNYDSYK